MRVQGQHVDEVDLTPHHSKIYTDVPATRSPVLTVFLAIVILTILTLGAWAAVHWYQRRSANPEVDRKSALARNFSTSGAFPFSRAEKPMSRLEAEGWPPVTGGVF